MHIADFEFNFSKKTFIIAELSANHGHSIDIAIETIHAAKRAGADAIKLQTYKPETLTINCDNEYFTIQEGLWKGRTLFDLYKEAYTPWEWHEELFKVAKQEGLICFSSPFDKTAVDFLEQFNPPVYKIASFEIQDIQLIEYIASKGLPIIISTGIAELEDIELAIQVCRDAGNNDIILLKCTSAYPAPIEEANLITIADLKERFNVEVGLSDHTMGIVAPIVAVSFGARVIEKHFILDKSIGGPDATFSLDEKEFSQMVKAVRQAEQAIGVIHYELIDKVKANRKFSRSLFVVNEIHVGDMFTHENIRCIRPGFGVHPKYLKEIIGKRSPKNLKIGEPIKMEYF